MLRFAQHDGLSPLLHFVSSCLRGSTLPQYEKPMIRILRGSELLFNPPAAFTDRTPHDAQGRAGSAYFPVMPGGIGHLFQLSQRPTAGLDRPCRDQAVLARIADTHPQGEGERAIRERQ